VNIPMWNSPMDGAESRLWAKAYNRNGEFFLGQSLTGVAEKSERQVCLMGHGPCLRGSPFEG
jgi:hypothetical protein